ncbi:MAG TPA: triose-phosphate isomerase [Thermoanaerobaculia bacterium]|nr:triose-phosphate isomerase [Thermoanaerobaculia bacterium]
MSGGAAVRRPLVAANWKMHLLAAEARAWCRRVRAESGGARAGAAVFPSFPLLPVVASELAGGAVETGGQDLHPEDKGAFTGDVSAAQLADAGCVWALCGHSERRHGHGEGDELVARKAAAAVRHGLRPLLCVGETRDERRGAATEEVLARQLRAALPHLPADWALAYEPVWAIGTGDTATPETAQAAHAYLRGLLAGEARRTPILYGGSVTPENAAALAAQPDVDGFLVGGASLDPGQFLAIIRSFD